MRELTLHETQDVAGGIGIDLIGSFFAGMQQCSFQKTIIYTAAFDGVCAAIAMPLVGLPLGIVFGAAIGYIGYSVGSLFARPMPVAY